jgi:molecular chaperone HtpG
LTVADKDDATFELDLKQLENLLRTKTAVGSTKRIWETKDQNDLSLSVRYASGKIESSVFECQFLLPTEDAKKSLSLDAYREWAADGTKSDEQKRRKLKDALLFHSGSRIQSGREIRYWSCMAPSRKHWAQFAVEKGLIDASEEDDAEPEQWFFVQFGEVFLSTKYMPTGVTIELRPPGEAGYTENFFIIIEDESLSFDIGRKGIAPRTAGVLRKIAQDEFREYLKFKRFLRGEATTNTSVFEREKLFEEIRGLPDLKCDRSRFIKRPNGQEATVAALFYEQLGKGGFVGFKPLISGYRDRYDLTGRYDNKNLILEFKFDLSGLFSDFTSARKMFDEVNVLIVWEITEVDRKKAQDRGIEIDEIDAEESDRIFPDSDTLLSIDSVAPIEVVQLKKLLRC